MHEYNITSTQRDKAYEIACKTARYGNQVSLDAEWQKAIAELILKETFQFLNGDLGNMAIDIKCCRVPFIHPDFRFYLNVQKFIKVKSQVKYVICCGINDVPKTATKLFIFGWVESKNVERFPVNTKCTSPAFMIPIRDMQDIYMLFCKPEFDGEKK